MTKYFVESTTFVFSVGIVRNISAVINYATSIGSESIVHTYIYSKCKVFVISNRFYITGDRMCGKIKNIHSGAIW